MLWSGKHRAGFTISPPSVIAVNVRNVLCSEGLDFTFPGGSGISREVWAGLPRGMLFLSP